MFVCAQTFVGGVDVTLAVIVVGFVTTVCTKLHLDHRFVVVAVVTFIIVDFVVIVITLPTGLTTRLPICVCVCVCRIWCVSCDKNMKMNFILVYPVTRSRGARKDCCASTGRV